MRLLLANTNRTVAMDAGQQKNESGETALQASTYENISRSETETITCAFPRIPDFAGNELIRLGKRDYDYEFVENMFLTGMGNLKRDVTIEAIKRIEHSSLRGKAQARAFEIFSDAMEEKHRSTKINIKYGWYANSKEEISKILRYGFSQYKSPENGCLYGCGIYLVTEGLSILSVPFAVIDEDGLQHLLLCRAILGNQEVVCSGSKQFHPSSEEFDSGVDDHLTPKIYIVWSANMNTHILPKYIISFKALSFPSGVQRTAVPMREPTSPWVTMSHVVSVLQRKLPRPYTQAIDQYHRAFLDGKITRGSLVMVLRQLAGDNLLKEIIQLHEAKKRFQKITKERVPSHNEAGQM